MAPLTPLSCGVNTLPEIDTAAAVGAITCKVYCCTAAIPSASIASTVNINEPVCEGVPQIVPSALKLKPGAFGPGFLVWRDSGMTPAGLVSGSQTRHAPNTFGQPYLLDRYRS